MYVTGTPASPNFKAYPEDVTRLNEIVSPVNWVSVSLNAVYHWNWYSPRGSERPGAMLLNGALSARISHGLSVTLSAKNILNQLELYPMNNNAGDAALSDRTPAVESRTFWMRLAYRF